MTHELQQNSSRNSWIMQWFSTYVYYIKIKCMEESGGSCLHDVLMNDASLTFDLRS